MCRSACIKDELIKIVSSGHGSRKKINQLHDKCCLPIASEIDELSNFKSKVFTRQLSIELVVMQVKALNILHLTWKRRRKSLYDSLQDDSVGKLKVRYKGS